MNNINTTVKSLSQAISIWSKTQKVCNTRNANLAKIALKLYVLPKMGYQSEVLSSSEFSSLCGRINCLELNSVDALSTFDQTFAERIASGSVSLTTKKNYRSALGQFFNWLKTQPWYTQIDQLAQIPELPRRVYAKKPLSKTYDGKRIYGLSDTDLTTDIGLDLEQYVNFWRQGSSSLSSLFKREHIPQDPAERKAWRLEQAKKEVQDGTYSLSPTFKGVKETTIKQRKEYILRFLGWCVNIEGYKIQVLSIHLITSQSLYQPYIEWLMQNRSCGASVGIKLLDTAISVAKFSSFEESRTTDWSDIPLVEFLKQQKSLYQTIDKGEQPAKQQEKWEQKEISHEEAREVVEYLHRTLCSSQYFMVKEDGSKKLISRSFSTIVENWQIYLMVKILVYAPVRQEELRKLRIDDTLKLVEDSKGILRYAVRIKNHKNTLKTGQPRYYPLPSILTDDITKFVKEIRPLAINAPKTLENWLEFWDFSEASIINLEKRLQKAEASDNPDQKYICSTKLRLRAMKNRCQDLSVARVKAENCNHLFFALGRSTPNRFCASFEEAHYGVITNKVAQAVGNATLALFNEPKFLNPHGFRHIGSKHLREIGKSPQKDKFSLFVGHSIEIDDYYANQIINEYDLIEQIVDEWWHEQ